MSSDRFITDNNTEFVEAELDELRTDTGYVTLDPGYKNTGSTKSAITYLDGEQGILRYRGYPIEELAKHSTFLEVAWLLLYGELPKATELDTFKAPEDVLRHSNFLHI